MDAIDRLAHTPGPWALRQHGPHHFTVTGQSPGLIADIHTDRDAALVRAAPDLLAALEAAIPALIRLGDFVGNVDPGGVSGLGQIDRCALIAQARQAISKAKEI